LSLTEDSLSEETGLGETVVTRPVWQSLILLAKSLYPPLSQDLDSMLFLDAEFRFPVNMPDSCTGVMNFVIFNMFGNPLVIEDEAHPSIISQDEELPWVGPQIHACRDLHASFRFRVSQPMSRMDQFWIQRLLSYDGSYRSSPSKALDNFFNESPKAKDPLPLPSSSRSFFKSQTPRSNWAWVRPKKGVKRGV
jgi:hypothetical protein